MLESIRSHQSTSMFIVSGDLETGASSGSAGLALETFSEGSPTLTRNRKVTHHSGGLPELPTQTSSSAIGTLILEFADPAIYASIASEIPEFLDRWLDAGSEAEWPFATYRPNTRAEVRRSIYRDRPLDAGLKLAERQRSLLQRAGGGLRVREVAQLLRMSPREVEEERAAKALLAVRDPDNGGWIYPACQFKGGRLVSGLPQVLAGFTMQNPWTQLYVLISENPALDGRSPIQALAEGEADAVLSIARGYGEQGAI